MDILITGASGYIGSAVARELAPRPSGAGRLEESPGRRGRRRRAGCALGGASARHRLRPRRRNSGDARPGELPGIGTGTERRSLVHVEALADLYVRALAAPAGSILHRVSTVATVRETALLGAAAGRSPATPVQPLDQARASLGTFADALALDQDVSAERTRETLQGHPRAP